MSGLESNMDPATVAHFGEEWSRFTHRSGENHAESLEQSFLAYFAPLPDGALNQNAVAGDFGAGSGRWARFVAPRVRHLYVLEPSPEAMNVARTNLAAHTNITYLQQPIGWPEMPRAELDVAYSIGVIHHIPDPVKALRDIRAVLKVGGVFLGYLYYAFDNRPAWYRNVWRISDQVRSLIGALPARRKQIVADICAAAIYWPLARLAWVLSRIGVRTALLPLHQYADQPYYVMRNDALDRLGTPLEQRFTRTQITDMLHQAGFDISTLVFSDGEPFWCFSVANPGPHAPR